MRSLLDQEGTKIQVSGHETFPCRYGWLKKAYDAIIADDAAGEEAAQQAFSPTVAIAEFGVGKNMVAAIRHWALACGVLEPIGERVGRQELLGPTRLGALLFGDGDPYLERPGSLWLLHWRLASLPKRATAWYFAFNEFNDAVFTKETLSSKLWERLAELRDSGRLANSRIAKTTVDRDAECMVRTYVTRRPRKGSVEDGLECPFAELALVGSLAGGALQFRRGPKPTLPDEVFAMALAEFWKSQFASRGALSIEVLAHEPGSPGRVFLLDEDSLVERLERIDDVTKRAFVWDEGAGLRQVSRRIELEEFDSLGLVEPLYERMEKAA